MIKFSIHIAILACLSFGVLAGSNVFIRKLDNASILYICSLFAANAWLAIVPYYLRQWQNPLKVFVVGSIFRTILLGIALSFYYYQSHHKNEVFFIYCMITFIIFQTLEIRQLIREKGLLS